MFTSGDALIVGNRADDVSRRFQLLGQHVDGNLRKRISLNYRENEGSSRSLDYFGLLSEKENQIIELQRKIVNLEERLKRSSAREA